MKARILSLVVLTLALVSISGALVAAPDDLDDAYKNLKDAEAKKDADQVKQWSAETSKLARAIIASPQPSAADEVEAWKQKVDYAKQVDTYTEYSLSITAMQPIEPAKVVDLFETLEARNGKSQYLAQASSSYLAALTKLGHQEKLFAGAGRVVKYDPNNEDALYILADGYRARNKPDQAQVYATKLVSVMKSKPKPEGYPEADWERKKTIMLGRGYWTAGVIEGDKQDYAAADRDLRAALPMIEKEPALAGPALFYLGVANYQLGKLTSDKSKLSDAAKFSDRAAAIPGPYQSQAAKNSVSIKAELAKGPLVRK